MKKIKTVEGFDIYFEAEEEWVDKKTHYIKECGWSEEEYKKYGTGGKWFCAKVVAKKADIELSTQYLGCCHYDKISDFYHASSGYFDDMVAEAVAEAKEQLPKVIDHYSTIASKLAA